MGYRHMRLQSGDELRHHSSGTFPCPAARTRRSTQRPQRSLPCDLRKGMYNVRPKYFGLAFKGRSHAFLGQGRISGNNPVDAFSHRQFPEDQVGRDPRARNRRFPIMAFRPATIFPVLMAAAPFFRGASTSKAIVHLV